MSLARNSAHAEGAEAPISTTSRLALGTAQFGSDYGINNVGGRVSETEAEAILRQGIQGGIDTVDTAQAYGRSEAVIGAFQRASAHPYRIVTKFAVPDPDSSLSDSLDRSLAALGQDRVYGFLAHDFDSIRRNERVWDQLQALREEGRVEKIGFSVYHPVEIEWAADRGLDFDLVQIPHNVFDRRFEELLPSLVRAGIAVHARSAFLQGLFFCDPGSLSSHFHAVKPKLERFRSWASERGHSLPALLLGFCLARSELDRIVVGVDSLAQLQQNLAAAERLSREEGEWYDVLSGLAESDEQVLLPLHWR